MSTSKQRTGQGDTHYYIRVRVLLLLLPCVDRQLLGGVTMSRKECYGGLTIVVRIVCGTTRPVILTRYIWPMTEPDDEGISCA